MEGQERLSAEASSVHSLKKMHTRFLSLRSLRDLPTIFALQKVESSSPFKDKPRKKTYPSGWVFFLGGPGET